MIRRELIVPAEASGARLDRFLADTLGLPRRRVTEAIERGRIRVDGRRARKGQPVEEGQRVVAEVAAAKVPPLPQPELPVHVVLADPDFVVVDKPAGWPTHPLEPEEKGTLANALVARWPEMADASADPREGGVAHRLDAPTSGLVVAARSRQAWESLRGQFAARTVHKEYLALAKGRLRGVVDLDAPLGMDPQQPGHARAALAPQQRERFRAREAHTRVEALEALDGWTLVRCTITTGVMHQIRAHMLHLGAPLAGDPRYGDAELEGLDRLFLHASVLGFDHPRSGERMVARSELPADLEAILERLRAP